MHNAALLLLLCAALSSQGAAAGDTEPFSFFETFDGEDPFGSGRWEKSDAPKYARQPLAVKASASAAPGFESDKGVTLTQENKHYGFGARFSRPLSLTHAEDELRVQYQARFEEGLKCGGAYVKLLRSSSLSTLDSHTPYSLMFGPDRCGATNKVHLIAQYRNPRSGLFEEHHFNESLPVHGDKHTHLYALRLRGDGDFEISIDDKPAKKGNLLTHLNPPINPPRLIDDPQDVKPRDWEDEPQIDDPSASKPADWDESQPRKVPDAKASKPADWLDDEPLEIPDPHTVKPADWDDEEDGEWEAPLVPNPKCAAVSGCGLWTAPLTANPLYRGKWKAPKIANPNYKGPWKARQIPNPEFFEDLTPALSLAPSHAIAFELWTTNAGLHFGDVLVTLTPSAEPHPDALVAQTHFLAKAEAERKESERAKKEAQRLREAEALESGTFSQKLTVYVGRVADWIAENPVPTFASMLAVLASFMYLLLSGSTGASEGKEEIRREAQPQRENAKAQDEAKPEDKQKNGGAESEAEVVVSEKKEEKEENKSE